MKEIIEYRLKLLNKAIDSKELQSIELKSCETDILYFFRNYLYTDRNLNLFSSDEPSVLPFIPFEFQEELITEVWSCIIAGTKPMNERDDLTNVFIEKSRQMGMSWIVMGIFLYGFLFHNHKYLVISQKEDDVDKIGDMKSLFEKIRFMINNLPVWMLPKGFEKESGSEHNKYKSISNPIGTGSITGESANPNASRGGTYNAIFLDEMAFMQHASAINTAAASATPCRIFNSTPNGEGNEFYRMRKLTQYRKDENGEELKPDIKGLRYHWSDHPLYDDERYGWKKRGMTPEKIAQELEIDYNTAIIGRVYPGFKSTGWDIEYSPVKPMYVWIDNSHGGSDPHAIIIAQTDPKTHFIDVIDCVQLNCSIPEMANFLSGVPRMALNNYELEFLDRYKMYNRPKAVFISDPYDSNSTIKNVHNTQGIVIAEEYRKVGIHLNTPNRIDVRTRIMNTKAQIYRVRVHKRCDDFVSAIQNARYPELNENNQRTTSNDKPVHDWTSHYRSAMEYGIARILENEYKPKERVAKDTRPQRNKITGALMYPHLNNTSGNGRKVISKKVQTR